MTAMSSTTILFGVLLTLLGLGGYFLTGASSPTALIPTIFGLLLLMLGALARSEPIRKHPMHRAGGMRGRALQPAAHACQPAFPGGALLAGRHGGADSGVRGPVRQVFHRRPARAHRQGLTPGVTD